MRPNRRGMRVVAAWLGVIALSLNALFPIRVAVGLAADLADARECGHYHAGAAPPDLAWHVLALLVGHDATADPSQSHQGLHPVGGTLCGFVATPAAVTASVAAALPPPARLDGARLTLAATADEPRATVSAYHSRAPPTRTV
jgi:hypothetical protein